ncbi:SDR family oxidoreductase [Pedobacter mucosus]|uniref:SDR family oxidoreductase n=1 Tax=Pedobacter mucosus TaxID=2895286 RepID=UPI001EE4735F|nr:SDR family NAD(P)-dependent oxidoreductase [Pedobacter mucosus]UKT65568.1 SDR family NAD(P)-dependent oxidoreductase [Pedobacter mucosus]
MKTSQNTVLLIGGTAGIGLEIAKKLTALNNHVIITGRNKERLDAVAATLDNVTTILSDVSKIDDVDLLINRVKADFPQLNMVINNAGRAILYNLADEHQDAFANAEEEMLTNYLSIIRINQKLLPILKQQAASAIINVSSVVAYVPGITLPGYAASKAALHSYTTSLRLTLEETTVKVFELMPPLVDTEFSKEIGGHNGIKPSVVADEFISALVKDEFEIRVGDTAKIYELFRQSPIDALNVMNANRKAWVESINQA